VFAAVLPTYTASLSFSQDLPMAPGSSVQNLTPEPGFFTEPGIAINPRNPTQVTATFQDNAHIAYSGDAGKTWQIPPAIAPPNYRVSGDVSITYDNAGHAILCYMAFDKLGTFNYWGHDSSRNGLFVRRSLDGGKTWEAQHIPIIEWPTESGVPWEDKPYVVADATQGHFGGNLYVGWTRWTLKDSEILLSRSTDGGLTWSKPVEIDDHPGLPRDDNGAAEGFAGTVGPDGTLYMVWAQDNKVVYVTSRDGGKTFSHAREILQTAPIMFQVQSVARSNGFPQIALDPRGGPEGGKLYVTWSDYRNGDTDVFVSTSTDHGKTWSEAARVNNDPVHNGADQFFQWLAVDPADGSANVLFYDRRGDPANRKSIMVLARSTDGGKSFTNFAWTKEPFDANGIFIGDYTGIAALNGRVYGIWTEKPVKPPAASSNEKASMGRPGTVVRVGVADFNPPNSSR
jgi:hypothetical protein